MTERPQSDDPIELLREQIRAATDAAERLVREAAPPRAGPAQPAGPPPDPGSSSGSQPPGSGSPSGSRPPGGSGPPPPRAGQTPPSGWDSPDAHREAATEIEALSKLFSTVRDLLPEDIQRQITELIRQLLLLLRAIIDWAVSRIEGGPRGRDVQVEDIPIA
jgi:hypothetical protein